MSDNGTMYRAFLAIFGAFAIGAVLMGSYGLFVVLTGGTTDGQVETDVLGAFDCDEFAGDLEMAHEPDYEVERTVLSGTEIESFEAVAAGEGYRYTVTMAGELLDASARRADGRALTVEQAGTAVRFETTTTTPFRLWIDTIAEEATVTRTRLDVCPPT